MRQRAAPSEIEGELEERGVLVGWQKFWASVREVFRPPDLSYGNQRTGSISLYGDRLKVVRATVGGGGQTIFFGQASEISHFEIGQSRVLATARVVAVHRNGAVLNIGNAQSILKGKDPINWQNQINALNTRVGVNAQTQ